MGGGVPFPTPKIRPFPDASVSWILAAASVGGGEGQSQPEPLYGPLPGSASDGWPVRAGGAGGAEPEDASAPVFFAESPHQGKNNENRAVLRLTVPGTRTAAERLMPATAHPRVH